MSPNEDFSGKTRKSLANYAIEVVDWLKKKIISKWISHLSNLLGKTERTSIEEARRTNLQVAERCAGRRVVQANRVHQLHVAVHLAEARIV